MTDVAPAPAPLPSHEEFVAQQASNPTYQNVIDQGVNDVQQIVQTPTVNAPVPPSVITDASGVSHVIIPLTKKTKAYIGTGLAVVSDAAALTAFLTLPDNVRLYAAIAAFAAGKLAVFFGIVLPVNLPVRSDKV